MSQTLSASTLLAVPLAPLAGALLAGIFGTALGGNWIGRRLSHSLTILGVLVAFILSAMTLKSVAVDGARFNETLYTWMVVGGLKMEIGFLVDGLTAMMILSQKRRRFGSCEICWTPVLLAYLRAHNMTHATCKDTNNNIACEPAVLG
jgi:hypothetical protein